MELLVSPYAGIGEILLGQSVDQVRSIYTPSRGVPPTNDFTDYFKDIAVQIQYKDFEVVFIGITNPDIAKYQGVNLLEKTFGEIRNMLKATDNNIYVEDGCSILYLDTGLCFYSDDMEDENCPQQAAVFVKGYYDEILHLYKKY